MAVFHTDFTPRYINPFTDFGFKKLFGEEPNKDLLIDFVNQLLKDQNIEIKDLTLKRNEHLGATDLDRKVVLDLYCENERGEKFIVEMQKAKQSFFKDRTLFYSTFPIQEQALKGSDWNYELKAVYAIAVLDFEFEPHEKNRKVVTIAKLTDTESCKVFYDKLTFIYVQMPIFNKSADELESRLDKWLYVLKNLEKFERIPEKIKDKIFEKVFKLAEFQKLTKSERDAYEDSLKYYRDLKNSLDTAFDEGKAEAEKELLPKIEEAERKIEEAEQKIEDERRQKEEAQNKLCSGVKKMFARGISVREIAEDLGLSENEVSRILETL